MATTVADATCSTSTSSSTSSKAGVIATAPPLRDHGTALMEVRFAVCYGELNERFWSHFDTVLTLVQGVAGSLALAGVFIPGEGLTAIAGVVLATISGVQTGLKPRERSVSFRDARRQFQDLNIEAEGLDLAGLDRRLQTLIRDAPPGFASLLRPAESKVLMQHGYPAKQLGYWERFMSWCA